MVSRLENDKRELSAVELRLLHDAFGWDPRALIGLRVDKGIGPLPALVHEEAQRTNCPALQHAAALLEVDALLDTLGCPNPPARDPWRYRDVGPRTKTWAEIAGQGAAKALLLRWPAESAPGTVWQLAEPLGVDVLLAEGLEDVAVVHDEHRALAVLRNDGDERQTANRLATALGYLVFDDPALPPVVTSRAPLYPHLRAQAFADALVSTMAPVSTGVPLLPRRIEARVKDALKLGRIGPVVSESALQH
jgi:hypothetical protein